VVFLDILILQILNFLFRKFHQEPNVFCPLSSKPTRLFLLNRAKNLLEQSSQTVLEIRAKERFRQNCLVQI